MFVRSFRVKELQEALRSWPPPLWRRLASSVATRIHGHDMELRTGEFGILADGNCTARLGKTTVFAAAVCRNERNRTVESLPLQVRYREPATAAARFPRPGMRGDESTTERGLLVGGTIERALRPLFPAFLAHDVCVTATALSVDAKDADPDVAAILAASGALMCSDIPWHGPLGACRIVRAEDSWVVNPTPSEHLAAELSLLVAGTRGGVVMLEAQGRKTTVDRMREALDLAQLECEKMVEMQWELAGKLQLTKRKLSCAGADPTAAKRIESLALPLFEDVYSVPRSKAVYSTMRDGALTTIREKLEELGAMRSDYTRIAGSGCVSPTDLMFGVMMVEDKMLRRGIFEKGLRLDGRLSQDLLFTRPVWFLSSMALDYFSKKIHSLFAQQRSATAWMRRSGQQCSGRHRTSCQWTVGCQPMLRMLSQGDLCPSRKRKRSPPLSVATKLRPRRSHRFADPERALSSVMPTREEFPWPVHIVAEATSSDGSLPQTAICGSSLALQDAGVPITHTVASVSIGLAENYEVDYYEREVGGEIYRRDHSPLADTRQTALLADLLEIEDKYTDATLEVGGTVEGFTALQLSTRRPGGIDLAQLKAAIKQSGQQLGKILGQIDDTRNVEERSRRPKYDRMEIAEEDIGLVIGKDGARVQQIETETGGRLMFPDQQSVAIYAPSQLQFEKARSQVMDALGLTIREGEVYLAKVIQVVDYGAFVELPTGFHALLHISHLSNERITSAEDVLTEGQLIQVKCIGRGDDGQIIISSKAIINSQDSS